jgi:hypothetical protein
MDRGGAVLDGVGRVEVALGREDVELRVGAGRSPPGRGLQAVGGAGEEDWPGRRHSVAIHEGGRDKTPRFGLCVTR